MGFGPPVYNLSWEEPLLVSAALAAILYWKSIDGMPQDGMLSMLFLLPLQT